MYDVPPVLKTGAVTRAAFTPENSSNCKSGVTRCQSNRQSIGLAFEKPESKRLFVLGQDSPQVDQDRTFVEPRNHGGRSQTQSFGDALGVRSLDGNAPTRQGLPRKCATARSRLKSLDRERDRQRRSRVKSLDEPLGCVADFIRWKRKLAKHGNLFKCSSGAVDFQGCLERGERELVDAHGPGQRI